MGHAAPGAWPWELRAARRRSDYFFRFAATDIHPESREPRGVFHTAGMLLATRTDLTDVDREHFEHLFDWFGRHLPFPRRVTPDMIFWFRPEARECASRIWELVHLLREHGITVQTMRTRRPGRIVYSDEMQVGAVPYRGAVRTVRVFA